jgi:hypothetical protein
VFGLEWGDKSSLERRNRMKLRTIALTGVLAVGASTPALRADGPQGGSGRAVYEVTITNVTRGQSFTPFLVVAHTPDVRLFEVGQPAGEKLEALAEEGNTTPLRDALSSMPGVHGTSVGSGLLAPGQTTTIEVVGRSHDRVSLAAMLIPTNDGFVAVSAAGPFGHEPRSIYAPAYDAGTEMNDESCASIPGPFYVECGGPGGGGAPQGGEEGFVRIHEGIHGVGDFVAATRDWRNPVAKVEIRRVR